jgi:hypothetical protein
MSEIQSEQSQRRGRGRPPLTEEQKTARDEKKAAKQRAYYLANRDTINEKQKEVKAAKYKEDPVFRRRAIEYISAYNRRRSAMVQFVEEWADKEFQHALKKHLEPFPHPNSTV